MFRDKGHSFNGWKHLTEKVALLTRVRVVHGRPHNAHPTAKIKISPWYFDQCLYPITTSSSVKNVLRKRFFYVIFFHSHPFNEMFIVSSSLHLIAVTTLLLTSSLHRC